MSVQKEKDLRHFTEAAITVVSIHRERCFLVCKAREKEYLK